MDVRLDLGGVPSFAEALGPRVRDRPRDDVGRPWQEDPTSRAFCSRAAAHGGVNSHQNLGETISSNRLQGSRSEPELSGASDTERVATLGTALSHLSPIGIDESGIAIAVNEVGRYATLNFEIPSGLLLSPSARARLEALRDRRIEFTDHTDRDWEEWFEFPATE